MHVKIQRIILLAVVFLAGMTSLAIEISASRLLAPYFGTSLFIWANLIGLELIYLTIGYTIGGRMADRRPSALRLYSIVAIAATFLGLIPLISRPILQISLTGFANLDFGAFYGSLLGTILLFAFPVILLGMVTPFAIRLEITKLDQAGKTAGQIYSLSTLGSILGTFVPVFIFIPTVGTDLTFVIFAMVLLAGALLGLGFAGGYARLAKLGTPLSVVLLIALVFTALPHTIKAGYGGTLITEKESLYNYIQVVKNNGTYELILNEGQAIHSLYNPANPLSGGEWDYFLGAPFFNNPPYLASDFHSAAIIGLGGGTIAYTITNSYGSIPIDGVEIDPEIVKMGQQYFAMNEKNLAVHVQDGRYFLATTNKQYDMIAIDAYQQPYIPFQLTTREFFQLARNHLTPKGVVAINVGRTATDYRLVDALSSTMQSVFKKVYIIDTYYGGNSIIVATNDDTTQLANFAANAQFITQPLLAAVANETLANEAHLRVNTAHAQPFTDDHAPVESIVDQILLGYIRNDGK